MNRFYLFRTNLRQLEYYHKYNTLEEFENNCHDFWLLMPLQLLKDELCDEVIIWRLNPKNQKIEDIIFDVKGRKYTQKWVDSFNECVNYPKPMISFFRGGFPEYDHITRLNIDFLGLKLYTGTGQRILPQHGGKYDLFLMEDDRDLNSNNKTFIPFYKTASPKIFHPLNLEPVYDLIWPANFEQINYKGQQYFIEQISKSDYLKTLKIVHVGNHPEKGKSLCLKYNVSNIEFKGLVPRPKFNELCNQSKFGIVTSNNKDGCPRVITEMICSGTPVLKRETTRLLSYYNDFVEMFNLNNIVEVIQKSIDNAKYCRKKVLVNLPKLSLQKIVDDNYKIWTKKLG